LVQVILHQNGPGARGCELLREGAPTRSET